MLTAPAQVADNPCMPDPAPEDDRREIPETPEASGSSAADSQNWSELVRSIRAGEQNGMEELYRVFSKGIRFFLCRQLGPQELDDKVHDTFLIVVQAIQRGDIREPERLMGFVRTIVRRQVAAYIEHAVHTRREQTEIDAGVTIVDRKPNPEQDAIGQERELLMLQVLRELSSRDRDILTRFYIHEQNQTQICREMNLTETQFRLLKSRAKARFGDLGKKRLNGRNLGDLFLRNNRDGQH